MKKTTNPLLWACLPMFMLPPTQVAWGQGADRLEEVVVTANRRESTLLDTPLAVSAFDASSLEKFVITGAQDLPCSKSSLHKYGSPSTTKPTSSRWRRTI